MFSALRFAPLIVGGTLLLATGVVHGLWTDRWGASTAMSAAAERLETVPRVIGDWQSEPVEVDTRQLTVAAVTGHLSRKYTERGSGTTVHVLLLCGRPGPLAVHRPEVCYAGLGYEMDGAREKWAAPVAGGFWTARFRGSGPEMQAVRIFWAWSTNGEWAAEEDPRSHYSPATPLYKLYVVRQLTRPDEALDEEPARRFLQVFLPVLQKSLGAKGEAPLPEHILALSSGD